MLFMSIVRAGHLQYNRVGTPWFKKAYFDHDQRRFT